LFAKTPLFSTVLEHFTVCYKQSITLQKFVIVKLEFI